MSKFTLSDARLMSDFLLCRLDKLHPFSAGPYKYIIKWGCVELEAFFWDVPCSDHQKKKF